MIDDTQLYELAERVGQALKARNLMLATAESCTGGWVSEAMTAVSGSSEWFDRAYVTYSNRAKQEMLRVDPQTLASFGAVSEETAREMATGAAREAKVDVSLAITGIAGPGGAMPNKPVGMICFAWSIQGDIISKTQNFSGNRFEVRRQSVIYSLQSLLSRL
jgi:nicotinamide-nucleotide amidase